MSNNTSKIVIAWWLLYGMCILLPVIAGVDKFFNYLGDWPIYLNQHVPSYFNITSQTAMYFVGIVEILVGLLVFIRPRIGGYILTAMLIGISLNLVSMGTHHHAQYEHVMKHYDVALHDIALAIASYVFVLLTEELGK